MENFSDLNHDCYLEESLLEKNVIHSSSSQSNQRYFSLNQNEMVCENLENSNETIISPSLVGCQTFRIQNNVYNPIEAHQGRQDLRKRAEIGENGIQTYKEEFKPNHFRTLKENLDRLIKTENKIIELELEEVEAHDIKGCTFIEQEKFSQAKECFQKMIELKPSNIHALYHLAFCLCNLNRIHEAIKVFEKMAQLEPHNSDVNHDLGCCYYKIGNFKSAIQYFKKSIKQNPNHNRAYYNLAQVFGTLQQFEEAITNYQKAIKIQPKNGEAYNNLGDIYFHMKRFADALNFFNQSITLDPQNILYYCNRGITYYIGKDEKAERDFKHAKNLKQNLKVHRNLSKNEQSFIEKVLNKDQRGFLSKLTGIDWIFGKNIETFGKKFDFMEEINQSRNNHYRQLSSFKSLSL